MIRLMMTVAAALAATMVAAPVAASNNATCDDAAKLAGWASGYWDDTAQVCRTHYPYNPPTPSQQEINANERRNHPNARAVYYGTPPAETRIATASIERNEICITFPIQPSELTGQNDIRRVGVYGGDGYHDSGVALTDSGSKIVSGGAQGTSRDGGIRQSVRSNSGSFLHFGDMSIDGGRQCVSAKGRLANAVPGTEFPVELRPKTAGRIVDATNPGMNCQQSTGTRTGGTNPAFLSQKAQGRCGQRHFTFRNEAHCAGAGGSGNSSAASCRIWVRVEN